MNKAEHCFNKYASKVVNVDKLIGALEEYSNGGGRLVPEAVEKVKTLFSGPGDLNLFTSRTDLYEAIGKTIKPDQDIIEFDKLYNRLLAKGDILKISDSAEDSLRINLDYYHALEVAKKENIKKELNRVNKLLDESIKEKSKWYHTPSVTIPIGIVAGVSGSAAYDKLKSKKKEK